MLLSLRAISVHSSYVIGWRTSARLHFTREMSIDPPALGSRGRILYPARLRFDFHGIRERGRHHGGFAARRTIQDLAHRSAAAGIRTPRSGLIITECLSASAGCWILLLPHYCITTIMKLLKVDGWRSFFRKIRIFRCWKAGFHMLSSCARERDKDNGM